MADDGNEQKKSIWPLPKFYFEIDFGDGKNTAVVFQEVSGLDIESQEIDVRKSNNPLFSTVKMPGIKKYGNISLKKGIFYKDNDCWDLFKQISMNTTIRKTILIKLVNQEGGIAMQWSLLNALPIKMASTDLKSDGAEVAVESMEIAHEGVVITNK